ncbi:UvrD-helicase domain-containing protein [Nocardioides sp. HM23]|uniref:UvrD-helicase domain-containing protein n=1 Tax=Nocardioides bizhenqiangii TaxID=3095076 RepID=UPI002ACA1F84|nr:UvrD-helicase domain-containing protein [Nocardioides sp. HM23]MDZ5619674.1 UvrD-helicase domain-containing protein [Nocardioides sp. HM23]
MSEELHPFDLTGPLPTGTTLLEASAGTGKTFTVGALVARYVAEGVATLGEMLVITFSRAATQELRARVREQLTAAERVLARQLATGDAIAENELLAHLLDTDPRELAARHERLRDALAAFDSATIATTHQFCHVVLRSLGVASESDTTATLVESLDELVLEVVDDLYLADNGRRDGVPPIDRATAAAIARDVVTHQNVDLAPTDESHPLAAARADLARRARSEVERRKQRLGIQSYDDLLARLAEALTHDDAPARARMRNRWRIVLVDEFQDTDPVQWQVLERAFHGHSTLILIGDPKQAIYGFRGGDVDTYLAAAAAASSRYTLATNRRSDGALVARLDAALGNAGLGSPDIVVHPVVAFHQESRLAGAPHPAPFRVRRLPRGDLKQNNGVVSWWAARDRIADDLAGDVAELLSSGATWCGAPLEAHQVAVLVADRGQGERLQAALQRREVPVVLNGGGDIFLTPAADEWLTLLKALDAPHRPTLVRSAALTCFYGHDVRGIVAHGDTLTGEVADELRDGAILLRTRGVAALVETFEERGMSNRILGRRGGERLLTDIRHLGQLLHDRAVRERLGLTALLEWLRDERLRTAAGERPRRLDSDAKAVQIVTIHGSKGLEYPVVYLPYAFNYYERPATTALFHDRSVAGVLRRVIDVGGSGRQWAGSLAAHQAEDAGEDLRKLYVALTRAQSQVVTWWAPADGTERGALTRILFGRRPGDREVPPSALVHPDERAAHILGLIETQYGGPAAEVAEAATTRLGAPGSDDQPLAARAFGRAIDTEWRRTSYSGLIRVEEQAIATSEPEVPGKDDEPGEDDAEELPTDTGVDVDDLAEMPSPMADLPAGAGFGSLVHAILEHADPEAPDLGVELRVRAAEQLRWWPSEATPDELGAALLPMNSTSLGPLADGLTLAQIPLRDRLRELDFEIPLAGGDLTRGLPGGGDEARLRDLAPVLRAHLAAGDPMVAYADKLELPPLADQALRGYLSGSIDVVLRLPSGRFVVVDYKTNRLGEVGRPVTAADYAPARLAEAMLHSHYPLQALLYSAVVHRYLRWRLPGYDPDTHLGGVLYLYVRGMCGPETPEVDGDPCGVFSWQPSAAMVLALSELLDGVR